MTLTIQSDTEQTVFEVCSKNQKFAGYPGAFYARPSADGGRWVCAHIDRRRWFAQLTEIAEWVNNELGEECLFEIG